MSWKSRREITMSDHCDCCSTNRQWYESHFDPNAEFSRGCRTGEFTVETEVKEYKKRGLVTDSELSTIETVLYEIESEAKGERA